MVHGATVHQRTLQTSIIYYLIQYIFHFSFVITFTLSLPAVSATSADVHLESWQLPLSFLRERGEREDTTTLLWIEQLPVFCSGAA
jgi:hypothetical protein